MNFNNEEIYNSVEYIFEKKDFIKIFLFYLYKYLFYFF